jgi:ubiquinone/menaquinone biosynthesis C-methylase UbiE
MRQDDFEDLRTTWDELANEDPLWAILSVPSKRGRKWDVEEFFRGGKEEVARVLQTVTSLHALRFNTALDFGCGVGRLTQALADHFQQVIGIDISSRMIELANNFNKQQERVKYVHNAHENLGRFSDQSFDFVYSNLVLQHMKPVYAMGYINEFFRITRPGGVIVFQIPSHLTHEYLTQTSSELPLSKAACQAQLKFLSGATILKPGTTAVLQFEVTNISKEEWLQRRVHPLNLGNHWLDARRRLLLVDDARSPLPGRLSGGEKATIPLIIRAPEKPGRYYLEVDLVQEGIRWFKNAGSTTLLVPIRVAGKLSNWLLRPDNVPPHSVAFSMHGIPKEDILALINSAGACLLAIEQHVAEWQSYKYYIARSNTERLNTNHKNAGLR